METVVWLGHQARLKALVSVKRPEPNFPRRQSEAAKRSRWLLVAVNLAGIALLLFVLYWRRRPRAA